MSDTGIVKEALGELIWRKDFIEAEVIRLRAVNAELVEALKQFTSTIDNTGGVETDDYGLTYPIADPDWVDLGEAYNTATAALAKARA